MLLCLRHACPLGGQYPNASSLVECMCTYFFRGLGVGRVSAKTSVLWSSLMWEVCSNSTSPNAPLAPTSGGPPLGLSLGVPSQASKKKVLARWLKPSYLEVYTCQQGFLHIVMAL